MVEWIGYHLDKHGTQTRWPPDSIPWSCSVWDLSRVLTLASHALEDTELVYIVGSGIPGGDNSGAVTWFLGNTKVPGLPVDRSGSCSLFVKTVIYQRDDGLVDILPSWQEVSFFVKHYWCLWKLHTETGIPYNILRLTHRLTVVFLYIVIYEFFISWLLIMADNQPTSIDIKTQIKYD